MDALLLQKRPYGDHHLILHFLTEEHGVVPSIAFGGQRSRRRFPDLRFFPTYDLHLELGEGDDLARLDLARVKVPREVDALHHLIGVRALRWTLQVCPPRAPEPAVWAHLLTFLDVLVRTPPDELRGELAAFGITLLRLAGWSIPPSRLHVAMSADEALVVVADMLTAHA